MDTVFTNVEYAAWLIEQAKLRRPYWYGCYHLRCTEELLRKKRAQYPEHYGSDRMTRYRADIAAGQICGDCVNGAIKGAVWSELGTREPVYKSHDCPDRSADGMFEHCKGVGMPWGEIGSIPDVIGVAVRFNGHVGVYVGRGEVVEWRGFKHGCVITELKDRPWTHWYRLPWVEYVDGALPEEPESGEAEKLPARTVLRRGDQGEDVRELQETLIALGFLGSGGADGDFGRMTEAAVMGFQTWAGLEADGEAGPLTNAALDRVLIGVADGKTVKEGSWRIRSGPGTKFEPVGLVKGGTKLIEADVKDWVPVLYNGTVCWIGRKAVE